MRLPWKRRLNADDADWIIDLQSNGKYRIVKGKSESLEAILFAKDADLDRLSPANE